MVDRIALDEKRAFAVDQGGERDQIQLALWGDQEFGHASADGRAQRLN